MPVQPTTRRLGSVSYPAQMSAPTRYSVGNAGASEQDYLFARNYGSGGQTLSEIIGLSPEELAAKKQQAAAVQQSLMEGERRNQLRPLLDRLRDQMSMARARGSGGLFSMLGMGGQQPGQIAIPGIENLALNPPQSSNLLNLIGRFR